MVKGQLEEHVLSYLKFNDLLPAECSVVIGVSGGPDSVALIYILNSINQSETLKCKFHIAHLNHQLRGPESKKDAEFVKHLAERLNLTFFTKDVDVHRTSKEFRLSMEEAARLERYKFLETCAKETEACLIAVAHSADDNVETILQRIIRGTGLLGMGGIKSKRAVSQGSDILVVRPLLSTWKKDIIAYLNEKEIPYRTDSSNLQNKYLRNKIRLDLIPLFEKEYNSKIKQVLINLGEIINENNDLLDNLSSTLLNEAIEEKHEHKYVLDSSVLSGSHGIVLQKLIRDILNTIGVPLKNIGYHHYKEIIKFIKEGKETSKFNLPSNFEILKVNGKLYFQTQDNESSQNIKNKKDQKNLPEGFEKVKLVVPGITEFPVLGTMIEAKVIEYENGFLERFKANKTTNEEAIDAGKVKLPLYVRFRMPGDRFMPIGSNCTKKIKDFFIDEKIPADKRNKIPVVVSQLFPIWVVGLRMDNRAKVSANTKKVIILRYYLKNPSNNLSSVNKAN